MHVETDGLPKHRSWKGPKLASTGLHALGGSWPGLPQAGPPGHLCRAHQPSGAAAAGQRLCTPAPRVLAQPRLLTVMQHWELPHECPRSNQTKPRSPPCRDPWFFTPNHYSTAAWWPHGTARTCQPQRFVPQKGDRGHGTRDRGRLRPRGAAAEGSHGKPGRRSPVAALACRAMLQDHARAGFLGQKWPEPLPGAVGVPRGGGPTETPEERRGRGSAAVAISEKNPARWEGPAGRDRGDRGAAPAALGGAGARVKGSGAQARSAVGPAASSPVAQPVGQGGTTACDEGGGARLQSAGPTAISLRPGKAAPTPAAAEAKGRSPSPPPAAP